AATIFYMLHHIIVKTNLCFAASAIDRLGGGEDLRRTGGLYRSAPWLAALFLIPALSLGGIPPFSGFWAKLALLRETLRLEMWTAAAVSLLVGIVTVFSMAKIWSAAFWRERPANAAPVRPVGAAHIVPMVVLAVATLSISLFPGWL